MYQALDIHTQTVHAFIDCSGLFMGIVDNMGKEITTLHVVTSVQYSLSK